MHNFFNPENTFFSALGKLVDMFIVNILWLLLCLPVVTIIPATTAMYYTVVKVIRKERSYAVREFFRSFKRNLKQGIGFSVLFVLLFVIQYIDFQYAYMLMKEGQETGSTLFGIFLVIAVCLIAVFCYVGPVLSRFEMKFSGILKTAFFMSARHLMTTIGLILILAAVLLGSYILVPGIFILPVAGTLLASFLIEKVFKRYMPKKEKITEEKAATEDAGVSGEADTENADEWYLE